LQVLLALSLSALAMGEAPQSGYRGGNGGNGNGNGNGKGGNGNANAIPGGIDFSGCKQEPDGTCCIYKESKVTSLQKEPILECKH
jgi:hypothetical protein